MKYIIVTGSAGLIGSQAVTHFAKKGYNIIGIDNDSRKYFFGKEGSNKKNKLSLIKSAINYEHFNYDIRDYQGLENIFKQHKDKIISVIHTAAQPSHDWAKKEPITDFTINANGTLNLLELTRIYCPDASFIFTSTNKVYGDLPNKSFYSTLPDSNYKDLLIKEEEYRYEGYFGTELASIDETMSIDNSTHSLFGVSKCSADLLCQEYGKYFNLNTGIFRGGCLTGPDHSGVELHGFLAYLIKCIKEDRPYTIFGYKGKQVRDNIHASDLISMFEHFVHNPTRGEVYNVGGGRQNSISILELLNLITKKYNIKYNKFKIINDNRVGDHIWYISDLTKFKNHYPQWKQQYTIHEIIDSIFAN